MGAYPNVSKKRPLGGLWAPYGWNMTALEPPEHGVYICVNGAKIPKDRR
jgi:hypothetical protein